MMEIEIIGCQAGSDYLATGVWLKKADVTTRNIARIFNMEVTSVFLVTNHNLAYLPDNCGHFQVMTEASLFVRGVRPATTPPLKPEMEVTLPTVSKPEVEMLLLSHPVIDVDENTDPGPSNPPAAKKFRLPPRPMGALSLTAQKKKTVPSLAPRIFYRAQWSSAKRGKLVLTQARKTNPTFVTMREYSVMEAEAALKASNPEVAHEELVLLDNKCNALKPGVGGAIGWEFWKSQAVSYWDVKASYDAQMKEDEADDVDPTFECAFCFGDVREDEFDT